MRAICLCAASSICVAAAAPSDARTIDFNVPSGEMAVALEAFGRQSGVNLIYRLEDVRGVRTAGARGRIDAATALSRILAGTGLIAKRQAGGTVITRAIQRRAESSRKMARPRVAPEPARRPAFDERDLIVVTATRRASAIDDVPEAIQSIDRRALENGGLRSVRDLARQVPGLSFTDEGARDGFRPFLRGLRSGEDVGLLPTTAVYLDDVLLDRPGRLQPLDLQLVDVERVEVLHGPQGTLYGAGAVGGVIRYISARPDATRASGEATASVSLTDGAPSARLFAMANVPLVDDRLAVRIAAATRSDAGSIDNINTGAENVDGYSVRSIRAGVRWISDDRTTLDLLYVREEGAFDERSWSESTLGTDRVRYAVAGFQQETTQIGTLTARRDLDWGALTLASSYSHNRRVQRQDITHDERDRYYGRLVQGVAALPPFTAFTDGADSSGAWSHELRLVSNAGGRLDWVVGGYSYRSDFKTSYQLRVPVPFEGQSAFETFLGVRLADDNETYIAGDEALNQTALFGEIGYRLTPQWRVAVGGRHFDVARRSRSVVIAQWTPGRRDADGNALFDPLPNEISYGRYAESGQVFRFNTSYHLAANQLIYLTVAQGFRPGGFNAEVDASPLPPGYRQYESDHILSYEIGAKLGIGHRLLVNSSIYLIDWSGMQTQVQSPSLFGLRGNGGRARVKGGELAIKAYDIPVRDLSLQLGLTVTDVRLTERVDGIGFAGERAPYVPTVSGSLLADYDVDLGRQLQGGATLSVAYTGPSYSDFGPIRPDAIVDQANVQYRRLDGYWSADLALRLVRGQTSLRLFADNLLNVRGEVFKRYQASFSPYRASFERITLTGPRTLGVEVRRAF